MANKINWNPIYIRNSVADKPKQVIDADYWNALWNCSIEQGDNNAVGILLLKNEFEVLAEQHSTMLNTATGIVASATRYANLAEGYHVKANEAATVADECAVLAKSWTLGGTGTREGEEIDNAKYYYNSIKRDAEIVLNAKNEVIAVEQHTSDYMNQAKNAAIEASQHNSTVYEYLFLANTAKDAAVMSADSAERFSEVAKYERQQTEHVYDATVQVALEIERYRPEFIQIANDVQVYVSNASTAALRAEEARDEAVEAARLVAENGSAVDLKPYLTKLEAQDTYSTKKSLGTHVDDTIIHITEEDRREWNDAAQAVEILMDRVANTVTDVYWTDVKDRPFESGGGKTNVLTLNVEPTAGLINTSKCVHADSQTPSVDDLKDATVTTNTGITASLGDPLISSNDFAFYDIRLGSGNGYVTMLVTYKNNAVVGDGSVSYPKAGIYPYVHYDFDGSYKYVETITATSDIFTGGGETLKASALPTEVTEHISDGSQHVTATEKQAWNNKSNFSGSYNDLSNKPTIPTRTSQLINDSKYLTAETDPTVPSWAKAENKPTYTAKEVGAEPANAVSSHNVDTDAHNDIRLLFEGLNTRLNALANSTDPDLDQMAEMVAYIKANRGLIEQVTTNKVNVSDIINNLTTNISNKPLSAAQGVALKTLIDNLQTTVNGKANSSDLTSHTGNTTSHITSSERSTWNNKANKATTLAGYGITDGVTDTEFNQLSEEIGHAKTRKDIFDQQYAGYVGGKNIIDYTKFTTGVAISTGTGEDFVSTNYSASPFISVSPNTSYCRNQACNVVFYNINFERIGGISESKGAFTTPEGTEYIRCSVSKWRIDRFQIERGTESTGFEEFGFYSKDAIQLDVIAGHKIGKNKFDKRSCVSGNVSGNTGDVYTSSTIVTSDYIAVIPGETYTRSHTGNYAFYDKDYTVIANANMEANTLQIVIPDGVCYIRLSFGKNYPEFFQFELGGRQTSYEDYGVEINDLIYDKRAYQNYIRSITRKPFPATITPTIDSPNGGTTITIEDKDGDGNLYGIRWDNKICKHTNGDDPYRWTTVLDLAPFLEQGETSSLYNMRVTDTGRICVATNKGRVLVSDEEQTTFTTAFTFEYGYTQTNWGSNKYKQYVMFCAYGGKSAEAPPHEIYISKDYGATWEKLFDMPIDEMINAADYHIHDAAYDPFSGMIIFVNGDTVNSQIHYTYDFGKTWDVVNHNGKSSIHPTSIVCLPRGIAFGSDDIPEGVYWWERPYGVDKPVIRDEDFVGVHNFNHDYTLQGVIGVKSDYIIANHGVYAAMPFINHMTSTPGNPRLIVTGDGGVSWHEIFKETDGTIKGFYGVQIVEENGKIRIYGNYSINGNIKMFVADMPVFYNP